MIRTMVRLAIWGLASRQRDLVAFLQGQGVLHVEHGEAVRISDEDADALRLLRSKLLGMIESLKWDRWDLLDDRSLFDVEPATDISLHQMIVEIDRSLDHFKEQLSTLLQRRADLGRDGDRLHAAHDVTVHFRSFMAAETEANRDSSLWWVRHDQIPSLLSKLQELLTSQSAQGPTLELHHHSFFLGDQEALIAIGVPVEYRALIRQELEASGLIAWTAPLSSEEHGLLWCIDEIERELTKHPQQVAEINATLDRVREEWGPKLGALFMFMDERLEQLVVEQQGTSMGKTFLLEGWLPEDELDPLLTALSEAFGEQVFVRWRYPVSDEWHAVPTALSNRDIFRPFEIFLRLVPLPRYHGTDPTVMIGIFFPFFAGCIIGDVGYGSILAILAWTIRKKTKKPLIADGAFVLLIVAFWGVAWGVAYGECFGDTAHRLLGFEPLWVERSHAVIPVLGFTIALGLAHILMGLALGVWEGIRNRSRHMWMERGGNMIIVLAMVGALCAAKGLIPQGFFTVAVAALILGLVFLVAGGGVGGLVESMSSFGSILSYVRIGAIGLSSAILAMVASRFVDVLGVSFLGVFIALSIHLLNFVLAIAESGLHSARLHYVEFMGTFHSGGGNQYRPFSRKGRTTKWKKR
ncbi:MAG: hypothetical protein CSA35_03125 [Dethiosulfovibrio peptidovorans]|nr:MAG: hypothetical protein CSA35_03125 [Dethiosulfovibrio peptidovorans]